MTLEKLNQELKKLNYVENTQKNTNTNFNYMGLNFEESPIPKMPRWNFFKDADISVIKGNRFSFVPAHTHDFIELAYMYSGSCYQYLNNQKFEFKQGQLLLMDKNIVQRIGYTGENDIVVNILIKNSSTIDRLLHNLSGSGNIITRFLKSTVLKTTNNNFIICDLTKNIIAENLIDNIIIADIMHCKDIQPAVDLMMSALLNQLESTIVQSQIDFDTQTTDNILDVLKFIEQNYPTTNLEKTSKYFGYNMNYLSNKIKKTTGQTFKDLRERKISCVNAQKISKLYRNRECLPL
jgi:RNA binding exosome subunit